MIAALLLLALAAADPEDAALEREIVDCRAILASGDRAKLEASTATTAAHSATTSKYYRCAMLRWKRTGRGGMIAVKQLVDELGACQDRKLELEMDAAHPVAPMLACPAPSSCWGWAALSCGACAVGGIAGGFYAGRRDSP